MISIKKYFLCALLFNTIHVSGMFHDFAVIARDIREQEEKRDRTYNFSQYKGEFLIEKLHDRINLRHLGVRKYDCCKSIKSAIASYYQSTGLSEQHAIAEIQTIHSYIPPHLSLDEKKHIFSQLIKEHSYVHYLMQNLVQHKFGQFKNVKGSTIDALYKPDFTDDSDGLKKQIYTDAKKMFCDYLQIDSYYAGVYRHVKFYYENRDRLFLLYLCHRAFENSKLKKREGELEALNNSDTIKLIQAQ